MSDTAELVSASRAQKLLGLNGVEFNNACESGELIPQEIKKGVRYFAPSDLALFKKERGKSAEKATALIVKAFQDSQEHNREILNLIVKPTKQTIDALLDENRNLRRRIRTLETQTLEVHEMYGQLMRDTIRADLEAEKERQNMQLRSDAFEVLKQQIPIITQSMTSARILKSFSPDQLFMLLNAGVLNDEQSELVRTWVRKHYPEHPNFQENDNGETAENGNGNGIAIQAETNDSIRTSQPRDGGDSGLPSGNGPGCDHAKRPRKRPKGESGS